MLQQPARTPPGPATAAQGTTTLDALRVQFADVTAQLRGLRAQAAVMERQIRIGRMDPGARAELIANKAGVDAQIAKLEAEAANLQGQIQARQGTTEQPPFNPPPSQNRQPDPDMVVGVSFVLAMCFVLPISIAIAKRVWRGKPQAAPAPKNDDIAPRLDRLEHAVDAIAIEIERIAEGQRFVTKIMAERPAPAPAPAAQESALSEGKPILALGAGQVEPIRAAAERQGVRQIITPH